MTEPGVTFAGIFTAPDYGRLRAGDLAAVPPAMVERMPPSTPPARSAPQGPAQFLVFAAMGAVGTLVQYLILAALVETGLAGAASASVAGATAGALTNYFLNRRHTFQSRRPHRAALAAFTALVAAGIAVNGLIVAALSPPLHYLVAQVIATVAVLGWNFAGSKWWVFRA
jgi:putative flippase GtrA